MRQVGFLPQQQVGAEGCQREEGESHQAEAQYDQTRMGLDIEAARFFIHNQPFMSGMRQTEARQRAQRHAQARPWSDRLPSPPTGPC